jgi:glycosyltransferase involved in cell wall biosynthesis
MSASSPPSELSYIDWHSLFPALTEGKKRALVVARWPVGGIRTHLKHNYEAVSQAGYYSTFLVPDDESWVPLQDALADVSGIAIAVPDCGKRLCLAGMVRAFLQTEPFDLVHAHGLTAAAHTALATVRNPIPFVVTVHEPLRPGQFPGLAGAGKRWLLGRALARAAAIITVSHDARDNLLRFFPNLRRHAHRVHTIPNGIDTDRYAAPPEKATADLRDELDLDDETLIGFLGRFMPEKGFSLLLEVIARLVRFGSTRPFHVVAFGSGDYRREYQRQIEQRGLADHVTLRDFVADVRPVLEQLDLVVVPSLWEASSLVSMEAMSAGVPVLGSDCPGLREVLRDTPSRTVTTGDVSALECALRAALAHPWHDEAVAFAPEARRRFDNRRSARRLVELYDALTARECEAACGQDGVWPLTGRVDP